MSVEIKMPQMGESITEGTVVRWFVGPGDRIERDAPLLEISTDKVDTEVPCPHAGWIDEILVNEGDTVPVDTPVCRLRDSEGGARTDSRPESESATERGTTPEPASKPESKSQPTPQPKAPASSEAGPRLTPAVRRLVREHGLDVSLIRGTGDGGRVSRNDVLAYLESIEPSAATLESRVEPLSVMRRKIAEHMIASRATSAHVSTIHEADFSQVRKMRDELRPSWTTRGVKLTYLPFLAQAIAVGLKENPVLNASVDGDSVRYHGSANLGIAVALDDGLIVPVLREVEDLSLFEIAQGIQDLADRARRKALRPEDVQGGTFTITNPGVFGTLIGTPIINQPQVAILCFGAVQKRVVVLDDSDAIAVRSMSYLSLTFDHRLIDGATADRFLQRVRATIESADFRIE